MYINNNRRGIGAVIAAMSMIAAMAIVAPGTAHAMTAPVVNEFGASDASTDNEFIEIFGDPSSDYSAFTILEIEGDGAGAGTIDEVITVGTTDGDGIWAAVLASNALENGTISLLLVDGFSGSLGSDLDTDDDGTLDATPWTAVVDSVAVHDGGSADRAYGTPVLDHTFDDARFDSPFSPGGASRIPDGADTDTSADWWRNDFDWDGTTNGSPLAGEALNTPGLPNQIAATPPPPPPTGGIAFPISNGFDSDDCTTGGWQVVSVDADATNTWSCSARYSNADVNGYGDAFPADEWLISPALDMTAQTGENLDFRSYTRYSDADYPQLEVLWSSDYDGADPIAATWTALTGYTLSPQNSGAWTDSGSVDLSAIDGSSVWFAFHYTSSGTAAGSAATWRLDGVEFSTGPTVSAIHDIQGGGSSVAVTGPATVDGVVTSLFTRDDVVDGFFLQEPDADTDADPATSEAIFVFCRSNCPAGLSVSDTATVSGDAEEYFGMSQIDAEFGTIDITGTAALPAATSVALPAVGSTLAPATFEAIEAMVVEFASTLAVSEYFQLGRFGQVVLTAEARPEQFTDAYLPSVGGYQAHLADLAARRIIFDDDNNDQNDAIFDGPDEPYPYGPTGLSTTNSFRGGDTITGLTGVLHWSWAGSRGTDAWRVRPIDGIDYRFTPNNIRPAAPQDVGGSIKVAAFNVLNYFTTIDGGAGCGPAGDLGCRGADSVAELDRQRAKTVSAILALGADVVALVEIENDAGAATADLVAGLDAATAPDTWAAIDTGYIGADAIKVALIYTPATVTPVGSHAILDSGVDPTFADTKNRPVLIQTFEEVATGGEVTVAANHLKSKGSSCDDLGDPDRGDGQARCPGTRTAGAVALANYLATDPTGSGDDDFLIIGDLNAYAMEDPITALEAAGYSDLLEAYQGPSVYSYVFDGQLGYLDHALANEALVSQVTGATVWAINADEVNVFDYNDDIRDGAESSFERESSALPIYAADPYRSSDHDPVIVGLDLAPSDDDDDGVPNRDDLCPDTILPDEPTRGLKPNRYAATTDGFVNLDAEIGWTLAETGGCSGAQIIEALGLGAGHTRFGITRSAVQDWLTHIMIS